MARNTVRYFGVKVGGKRQTDEQAGGINATFAVTAGSGGMGILLEAGGGRYQ